MGRSGTNGKKYGKQKNDLSLWFSGSCDEIQLKATMSSVMAVTAASSISMEIYLFGGCWKGKGECRVIYQQLGSTSAVKVPDVRAGGVFEILKTIKDVLLN